MLPPEIPLSAPRLGKFILVEKAGAGGGGVVWKAWDTEIGRWVAIKFLLGSGPDDVARFLREAQAAATLSHPNILRVYETGQLPDRDPFIAMQWVSGGTLGQQTGSDLRRRVGFVRDAARALHFAHERGTIHRDVKPDNIMIEGNHAYVLDFGLARTVEAAGLTASGTAMGTPSFMPPEQARGELRSVDRRSDVYGLGATLYHVVTGQPPFQGDTTLSIFMQVVNDDARSMRSVTPGVDEDLDTIVRCCLEKAPDRRYATAEALALDLDRWLAGEPIAARSPSITYRVMKSIGRRRGVWTTAAAGLLVVLTLVAVIGSQLRRTQGGLTSAQRNLVEEMRRTSDACLGAALDLRRAGNMAAMAEHATKMESVCARVALELPREAEPHYRLGRVYRAQLRFRDARRAQDEALARDALYTPARLERGVLRAGDYLQRIWQLRSAWKFAHADDLLRLHMNLPTPTLAQLEDDGARQLRAGIVSDLGGLDDAVARGILALIQDDPRWREHLERAAQESLDREEAVLWLCYAHSEQGTRSEAYRWLTKGIAHDRGYVPFYSMRAQIASTEAALPEAAADPVPFLKSAIRDLTEALRYAQPTDRSDLLQRRAATYVTWALHATETGGDFNKLQLLALADCREATTLDRADEGALLALSSILCVFAADSEVRGGDPTTLYTEARVHAEAAARILDSGRAHSRLSTILRSWGSWIFDRGGDAREFLEQALREQERACQLEPLREVQWLRLGYSHHNLAGLCAGTGRDASGHLAEAESSFDKGLRIAPDNLWLLGSRGSLNADWADYESMRGRPADGRFRAALADFDRAAVAGPGRLMPLSERGTTRIRWAAVRMARGEEAADLLAGAKEDLDAVIKIAPDVAGSYARRGELRLHLALIEAIHGRDPAALSAQALEDFDRSLAINPASDDALRNRSAVRGNLAYWDALHGGTAFEERFRLAEEDVSAALKINPRKDQGHLRRGQTLVTWGFCIRQRGGDPLPKYRAALDAYEQAIALNPLREESWMSRAQLRINWGALLASRRESPVELYAQAIADLGHAIQLNPQSDALWTRRGQAHVNLGIWVGSARQDPVEHFRAAIADYGEALRRNASRDETHLSLANARGQLWIWLDHRQDDEAEAQYEALERDFAAALEINPRNAETLWRRGSYRLRRKSWSDALVDFEAAVKINPTLEPRLREWIAECRRNL